MQNLQSHVPDNHSLPTDHQDLNNTTTKTSNVNTDNKLKNQATTEAISIENIKKDNTSKGISLEKKGQEAAKQVKQQANQNTTY